MARSSRLDRSRNRLPDFVVAGFPKAGTTSLAAHLSAHPEVWIPEQKELEFFDVRYGWGLQWYAAQFAAAPRGAVVGEATPTYLVQEEAIGRMARAMPHAKVIAILRNPVDRAFSHFRFREAWQPQGVSFEGAVHQEMSTEAGSIGLLSWGRYVDHLERLAGLFDREQIEVVLLDDLVADPAGVLAHLFRFLGVEERAELPAVASVENRAFRFRSVKLWHFMVSHSLWRRLPGGVGAALHRFNQVPLLPATMGAEVRNELLDYFEPHNARLAQWLSKDLTAWAT